MELWLPNDGLLKLHRILPVHFTIRAPPPPSKKQGEERLGEVSLCAIMRGNCALDLMLSVYCKRK